MRTPCARSKGFSSRPGAKIPTEEYVRPIESHDTSVKYDCGVRQHYRTPGEFYLVIILSTTQNLPYLLRVFVQTPGKLKHPPVLRLRPSTDTRRHNICAVYKRFLFLISYLFRHIARCQITRYSR